MENVKEIVKIGQKLTAHKGECIGRWQYIQTLNHTDGNSRDSNQF